MQIFYSPFISEAQNLTLEKDESRHLIKVLRMEKGAKVWVSNGKGNMFEASILKADANAVELIIDKLLSGFSKRDYYIHIAIAPTKNIDRIEWFVEKAVELGIEEISFIQSERSERKNVNIDRLERISVSAMKQSQKPFLPKLNNVMDLKTFLKSESLSAKDKFVGYLSEQEKIHLFNAAKPKNSYCILIGPEGDFTPSEINTAFEAGFNPITLGDYRLRTETAALVACHTLNLVNQV